MASPAQIDFRGAEGFFIEHRLGAGAFGAVYQARGKDGDAVALKWLHRADAEALYRFKLEFRALADINHPNLVSLYELMSDGTDWFFTMELVDGVDFFHYVHQDVQQAPTAESPTSTLLSPIDARLSVHDKQPGPPPDFGRLRSALRQLVEGLCALHEAGKLHCDLKPSNVLVTPSGRVVILDFGLVMEKVNDAAGEPYSMSGTPAYMSPEQGAGIPPSPASDWYSVGVMLFEALTGTLPFTGRISEVLAKKRSEEAPRLRDLVPDLPADLSSLCRDLLKRNPTARPSGREILRRLGASNDVETAAAITLQDIPPSGALIARDHHLQTLREAFDEIRHGQPATVFVHGPWGVGKSALVQRFLDEVNADEALILAGRCYERESMPYKALDSLVDRLSRYLGSVNASDRAALLPRDVAALWRLFPVLRWLSSSAGAKEIDVLDPRELRLRGFAALREIFSRLASRQPLVLFIDDLQWGDADSASLLIEILQTPNPPPLLFIGCYRGDEVDTGPLLVKFLASRTASGSSVRHIAVEELDPEASRHLALALLGDDSPAAAAHAARIAQESAGNPFFIHELARATIQGVETGKTSLDQLIRTRILQLPEPVRHIIELAAIAGQPVELEWARKAAACDEQKHTVLRLLRGSHLIRIHQTSGSEEIEVYHDRTRNSVQAYLSSQTRKALHYRLAATMEASGRADAERLALHFLAAGDRVKAREYAAPAAEQASNALAFDSAARFYRLAIELQPAETVDTNVLYVKLANALSNAGRGAEAAQAYLAAAKRTSGVAGLELERCAATHFLRSGHLDDGLAVIRNLLRSLHMKLSPTPTRALLDLFWRRGIVRLRGFEARGHKAAAVSPADLLRIDTCWSVAQGLGMVDPIQAASFQARQLLLALDAGEPSRIARALVVEAGYFGLSGGRRKQLTEKVLRAAAKAEEQTNDPPCQGAASSGDRHVRVSSR